MSKKLKFAAVLMTAAILSPSALAGGDGKPCFWKGGDSAHGAANTVAETPISDAPAHPVIPDENAVVQLDEAGGLLGAPEFLE